MSLNGRVSILERDIGPTVDSTTLPPVAWCNALGELVAVWQFQPSGHLFEYRYKEGDHYYSERPICFIPIFYDVSVCKDFTLIEYERPMTYQSGLPKLRRRPYAPLADGEGLLGGQMPEAWRDPLFTPGADQRLIACPTLPPFDGRTVVSLSVRPTRNGGFDRAVIYEDRQPIGFEVLPVGSAAA